MIIGQLIRALIDDISAETTKKDLLLYRDKLVWAIQSCARLTTEPSKLEKNYQAEPFAASFYALLRYFDKVGKVPDKFESLLAFVQNNDDRDQILVWYEGEINAELDELDSDSSEIPTDTKMLMQSVYALGRRNFWMTTYKTCQSIALGQTQWRKMTGIDASRAYFQMRSSKDMGEDIETSGVWHENTDAIEKRLNTAEAGQSFKTLLRPIDEHLTIRRGKTLVIAGNSGDGKTTLMLTLVYNFALKGQNVCVVTLELTQEEVWEALAFIHTYRFKHDFQLPSQFQWARRKQAEADGDMNTPWLTAEDRANMSKVIASIKARDEVPGLIDVQDKINTWPKIENYMLAHTDSQFSCLVVDYFGEKMDTPEADPKYRDKALNQAAEQAIRWAKQSNILLISPAQVKKGLKEKYNAEFVDDISKNSGFEAPYSDINCVRADQLPALSYGCDYCIGVWGNETLHKKNQGLICCTKVRSGAESGSGFPTFRYNLEPNSKYVRDMSAVYKEHQIKMQANTLEDVKVM